jgi:hypothetical protein
LLKVKPGFGSIQSRQDGEYDLGQSNITVFTGFPGGGRDEKGAFSGIKYDGIWWTTTRTEIGSVCYDLYNKGYLDRLEKEQRSGFSVRCIKD